MSKKKKKKKKKKFLLFYFIIFKNLLNESVKESHRMWCIHTRNLYYYIFIYLLIIIFISYDKKTQLFNIIH